MLLTDRYFAPSSGPSRAALPRWPGASRIGTGPAEIGFGLISRTLHPAEDAVELTVRRGLETPSFDLADKSTHGATLSGSQVVAPAGEIYKDAVSEIDQDDAIAEEVEGYRDELKEGVTYYIGDGSSA